MNESKIFMVPDGASVGNRLDPNLLLTTMMNNGGFGGNGNWIWILFLLLLFGRNGFGNEGTGYLSSQINDSTGRDLLMQAINGNGNALQNLAATLNSDINSVKSAINNVQSAVCQVGNQVGMSAADVKNAITMGNMNLAQQLATCCCDNKLAICQQTNALQQSINSVATGQERGFSSIAYEAQAQTGVLQNTMNGNTQAIIAKLDAIEDARKDREIGDLTAKLTAANSRAERQAELAPIYKALNDIECKQPNTVTVPYQPFVTIPNCVAWNTALFNTNGGSIWS